MYYCVKMALHAHLSEKVALVGVILTGYCSSRRRTPFQVQIMYIRLPSSGTACVKKVELWL